MERLLTNIKDTIGGLNDTAEILNIDLCDVYSYGSGFDILSKYEWELNFNKYIWHKLGREHKIFLVNAYELLQGDNITEAREISLDKCDGDAIIGEILKSDLTICTELANKKGGEVQDCFECAESDGVYYIKYALEH